MDKLTPIIGAEIGGVDLAKPLSNHQMDEVHRALAENCVIFFRDQHMTPEQHLAFGRNFGELHIHPAAPSHPDHPELMVIHADKNTPARQRRRLAQRRFVRPDTADGQHPVYHRSARRRAATRCSPSMYAAYEALSDRMKAYLDGMIALHDGEENYRGTYAYAGVSDKPTYPRAEHPVIRTHPVTGTEGAVCQSRLHPALARRAARRELRDPATTFRPTRKIRCSSAASAGSRTRWRSGTIAACSTARCGTTGRTRAPASA